MENAKTKIVWVSRHNLTAENEDILRRAFGEFTVSQVSETVDEQKLRQLVAEHGKDAKYVVVLPPNLISALLREGAEVYRFVVKREVLPDGGVRITPVGLEKVLRVVVETERVV